MPVACEVMGAGVMEQGGDKETVKAYFIDTEAACRSGQSGGFDVIGWIIVRETLMSVCYVGMLRI